MKLTSKVDDSQAFYVKDGPVLKSVKELLSALESNEISDESYNYHTENQDFARWIGDVYQDEALSKSFKRIKNKKTAIKKLKDSVK